MKLITVAVVGVIGIAGLVIVMNKFSNTCSIFNPMACLPFSENSEEVFE